MGAFYFVGFFEFFFFLEEERKRGGNEKEDSEMSEEMRWNLNLSTHFFCLWYDVISNDVVMNDVISSLSENGIYYDFAEIQT